MCFFISVYKSGFMISIYHQPRGYLVRSLNEIPRGGLSAWRNDIQPSEIYIGVLSGPRSGVGPPSLISLGGIRIIIE